MYGSEWQPCFDCGVRQRPEELVAAAVVGSAGLLGRQVDVVRCKDTERCRRFQEERVVSSERGQTALAVVVGGLWAAGERRGPVPPPPVPQTDAVKR